MTELLEKTENTSIQDIALATCLGISERDILSMDYFQSKRALENKFSHMVDQWFNGKKPDISIEEANELDNKYQEICSLWEETLGYENFGGDAVVRFKSIPEDDYMVVFYMGYNFDSDICKWADKMVKATKK